MPVHYFHCTDGVYLIVDRRGRETAAYPDVRRHARFVATEIMRAVPAYDEWSDWAVHVYDERGQVDIIPFTERVRRPPDRPHVTPVRQGRARQNTCCVKTGSTEPCHGPA